MIIILVFLSILNPSWSLADTGSAQELLTYYDCSTEYLPNLNVHVKVGDIKRLDLDAGIHSYLKGIKVKIYENKNQEIEKVELGKDRFVSIAELRSGIKFGIAGLTMHTIQMKEFDPKKGGEIEFGYLKEIHVGDAFDLDSPGEGPELLKWFKDKYGDRWGTFKMNVNKVDGQWVATSQDGQVIYQLYGLINTPLPYFTNGIVDMITSLNSRDAKGCADSTQDEDLFAGKSIAFNNKKFECYLPPENKGDNSNLDMQIDGP